MGFPQRLLAPHEKLVFDLKPHWLALSAPAAWTIVLAAVYVIAASIAAGRSWEAGAQTTVGIVTTLLWIYFALIPFLRWRFTHFVLTSDRLITRYGIIAKSSKEIPLERINDVAFNQTVIERVVGAGDLMLESAGERGQTRITNVRKPEEVQLRIYRETEANSARMMRPADTGEASVPEQIEALARLKDQGVLSEAEFETKKQELLRRL
jgi:uncharacterized membrane protein YdbT with pleckstrin-like domain